MLRPKPRGSVAWLPSQVVYGVDTSDPNPANWTPFGEHAEVMEAAALRKAVGAKVGPPAQSAPATP